MKPRKHNSSPSPAKVDKEHAAPQAEPANETADTDTDSSAEVVGASDADLAEDAAAHISRGQAADAGLRGGPQEIDRQAGLLVEWARQCGRILPDSFFVSLQKHPGVTAEHEVFHRPADNRAIKRSYAGTFGVTPGLKGQQTAATPLFYLRRLSMMNRVFNADLRLEGVAFGQSLLLGQSGPQPSIVISQPWVRAADPANPHPTEQGAAELMSSLGFELLPLAYFGWLRAADGVKIVDARPDNFIKSAEGVVAIDLVIEQSTIGS